MTHLKVTVHCVGGVKQRRKPSFMFCVSENLWRHSCLSGLPFLGTWGS